MLNFLIFRLLAAGKISLAALVLSLAACGGGGGGTPEADTTAPAATAAQAIVGTTVINLMTPGTTNVPVNALFAFTWNEGIEPCAQTGSFGALSGTAVCANNTDGRGVITLVAAPPPQYLARYDVVVTAVDAAGNAGTFSTWWVTEAAPDTTPPAVLSASIAPGATGISVTPTSIVLTLSKPVPTCDASKPVTLTSEFYAVVGTTACAGSTVTFTPSVTASRLFYKTAHTLKLPAGSVKDAAGNPLAADYALTFTTEGLPITGPRLYTANKGEVNVQQRYISSVDLSHTSAVTHFVLPGVAHQWVIAVDGEGGKVYSAGQDTARGVDVIDVVTGLVANLRSALGGFEYIRNLAVGPSGVYVAFANTNAAGLQPTLSNRIFRFDRLTQAKIAESVPLTDDALSPMAIIIDPTRKRIFVLSATISAINSFGCGLWDTSPGTQGVVTILHSESLAKLGSVVVGSVPVDGVVDVVGNRFIIGLAGDRIFATMNLDTLVVTTSVRPAGFVGCRQPIRMVLDANRVLWVTNGWDGVHTFNPDLVETSLVTTSGISVPTGITLVDGKPYVALAGTVANNSVVKIENGAFVHVATVGKQPVAVAAIVP